MNRIDRRDFLKSCCVAAVAGGVGSRAKAYFAPPPLIPATATEDTLVIVFLRGAMDGLSLLPPGGSSPFRADYEANRTNTRVPTSGTGAALPLANTTFALHPRATALQALYQANHLAFVVAAGQMQPNPVVRSHFEAQSNLEFGFGGGAGTSTGWLTRHLFSGGLPQTVPLPGDVDGQYHGFEPARQHRCDHDGERVGFPPRHVPLVVAERRRGARPRRRGRRA